MSHIKYCNLVYSPCITKYNYRRLQRIQNSCARFICGLRRRDHISGAIHDIGWLKVFEQTFLHYCKLCIHIVKKGNPSYLKTKLVPRKNVHCLNVRDTYLLSIPRHYTAQFCGSYSYVAAKVINLLHANNLRNARLTIIKDMLLKGTLKFNFKV